MNWAYNIKYRAKAAAGLFAILLVILLSNLGEQKRFSYLDSSISSIYKDRLMASNYLYDISNHLHEKRMLHEHQTTLATSALIKNNKEHNAAINALIQEYETTYLTKEEKKEWTDFKESYTSYCNLYADKMHNATAILSAEEHAQLEKSFANTMTHLNALSKIQIGEGQNLHSSSKAVINGTIMAAYLENSILIVLGIMTIVLLSITDKAIFNKHQNQIWN